MDKLIYIGMSAARQNRLLEHTLENNLANVNTTGFKADRVSFKSLYLNGSQSALPVKAYSQLRQNGVSLAEGALETTNRPLDIALRDNAWLSVTQPNGESGYVHSASLHVNTNGLLVTSDGATVNSENGLSITVPEHDQITIDSNGRVSVLENGSHDVINQLKIVQLPKNGVYKGSNGLIQVDAEKSGEITAATNPSVISGALEKSNVSSIETLIKMMSLSQQYEANVNALSMAKKNDEASNDLLDVR